MPPCSCGESHPLLWDVSSEVGFSFGAWGRGREGFCDCKWILISLISKEAGFNQIRN